MILERHEERAAFAEMVQRLVAEFAGRVPADKVMQCAARSREQLLAQGVRAGLVPATEHMARTHLVRRLPGHLVA